MNYRLICADVFDGLRELGDGSVQCIVTSPPYWGLRDYGNPKRPWSGNPGCVHRWGDSITVNATNHTDKRRWNHTRNGRDEEQPAEKRVAGLRTIVDQGAVCELCGAWNGALGLEPTPELYVEHMISIFREVRRVLSSDGTLWLNIGDSYSGSGKGRNADGTWNPGAGGSKQSKNVGSTIGNTACQVAVTNTSRQFCAAAGMKPKDLIGIPWRLAFGLQSDGWYLRAEIIWAKPNPMPESVTDRPTRAHEQLFLLAKSRKYFYDTDAIREPAAWPDGPNSPESISSPYGQGFTRRAAKNESSGDPRKMGFNERWDKRELTGWRNKRSVWTIATEPFPEAHFATFPTALVEPCVLAGSKVGDTILDPFAGSGTTGVVALSRQRNFVGIELNPQYVEMARRSLESIAPLFAKESTMEHGTDATEKNRQEPAEKTGRDEPESRRIWDADGGQEEEHEREDHEEHRE